VKKKCHLPINFTGSIVVIGPLGSDENLEEALALAGFDGSTAERILKGKDRFQPQCSK
jgi:hypothetical protein